MQRRTPQKHSKPQASAELTPAEALMLRLENIGPAALERMGAEEERRLGAKAPRWLGWRMDEASPVGEATLAGHGNGTPNVCAAWIMPAGSDGAGRRAPLDQARVYGNAMASHGLRHGDTVRIDHDLAPSDGDTVLAEVRDVGRVLRKLSVIGGVHILSADVGVKPIVIEDLSALTWCAVVAGKLAR